MSLCNDGCFGFVCGAGSHLKCAASMFNRNKPYKCIF